MRVRDLAKAAVLGVAASALAVFVVFAAPVQAQARDDSPCPPGQPPGRPPGHASPNKGAERGQYPIGECQLRLSQSVAAQGETIQAAGGGFASNSTVDLAVNGVTVTSVAAGDNGAFTADLQIPSDATVGPGRVTAEGPDASGGTRVLSANLTVVEAGEATVPAASRSDRSGIGAMLPRTGTGIAALAATGGGLIAGGTAAVAAARRRRNAVTA